MGTCRTDASAEGTGSDPLVWARALEAVGYGVLMTGADVAKPGPVIRFVNAAMCDLTGYAREELVGATPRILQGPETDRAVLDEIRDALNAGRRFCGEATNYRKDGSTYVVDWTIDPVLDAEGGIEAWVSIQRDVTGRHRARLARQESEERLKVLVAELQHRTRNLMGVVRSIADKTLRTSVDLSDFGARFGSRLDALARVQGLLSRLEDGDRVTFDELIRCELSALDGGSGQVTLDGPVGVRLRSATVQTLAMAIHELATNAQKHGALGQPGARLDVRWTEERRGADDALWLRIDWQESGVAMPRRQAIPGGTGRGQGRELIERALPYQLGGETSLTMTDQGIRCIITMPVSGRGAGR